MPVIKGNDVLTINGVRIAKQGVAHLKPGVTSEQAAEKTKANGMDEMIIAFMGPDGKPEKLIVYGDNLDFSWRSSPTEPDVRLNGEPGMLVHFEDEPNGFGDRFKRGVSTGFKETADTLSAWAKKTMDAATIGGGAALLGGTIWVAVSKGAALSAISEAIVILGPKVAMGLGAVGLIGSAIIVGSAMLKALAGGNDTKMETIAAVIDDNPAMGGIASHNDREPASRPVTPPTTNTPATPPKPPVINTPPAQNAPAGGSTAFDPAAILNALPKRK